MTALVREDRGQTDSIGSPEPSTGASKPRFARSLARIAAPRGPRESRRPAPDDATSVITSAMVMISLLCLWLVFQLVFLGGLSHERSQSLLYRDFRVQLANGIAPVGPVTPPGDPVALITIPSVGIEETVIEGTGSGDTLAGPGHLRNTVLPGQTGVSVVMGRSQSYGGPFKKLPDVKAGAIITAVTGQGTTEFTVLGVRRPGDPLPQPLAAGSARLTLVTSESSGALTGVADGSVLFVDADSTKALPAPAGLPSAVPLSERPMASDTGALPLLVLYLTVLLALILAVVAARQRYASTLVWVIGCPVVLAATWQTTDVVMRLLPNLL